MTRYSEIDWVNIFYYDPESPSGLRWLIKSGKKNTGDIAGSKAWNDKEKEKPKTWEVRYQGKLYKVHRILCAIYDCNYSDDLVINHIDNNPFNNSLENLEVVDQSENMRKCSSHTGNRLQCNNVTGYNGVSERNLNGHLYAYSASYRDFPSGKQIVIDFPINKYGKELSLLLAKTCREYWIEKCNEKGANYATNN
jgi:HNH endonuclease